MQDLDIPRAIEESREDVIRFISKSKAEQKLKSEKKIMRKMTERS